MVTPPLRAEDITAGLPPGPRVIGREVQVFAEVNSTNDTIVRAGALGAGEGLAVFAETQRAGRGRQGRPWSSAAGLGLWFSVLLRPPPETFALWPQLALWAALAVAETAEGAADGRPGAQIKWPNDVLLAGRKVAGILVETSAPPSPSMRDAASVGRFVVVGIGLNVHQRAEDFPGSLRARAGSLAMCGGGGGGGGADGRASSSPPLDRARVAADLLRRLDASYAGWPVNRAAINLACGERSSLRGRRLRVIGPGEVVGVVEGFDVDGGLRLRCDGAGEVRVISHGEVIEEQSVSQPTHP